MPSPPRIVCCGLACLDMELQGCVAPPTPEAISAFAAMRTVAGGSAPQTAGALAALGVGAVAVFPVAADARGRELVALVGSGVVVRGVVVRGLGKGGMEVGTAVAVVPVFEGGRGCFVNLGVNDVVEGEALLDGVGEYGWDGVVAFHFGYPHLMPRLQGRDLEALFVGARERCPGVLVTLDVNGVSCSEKERAVLGVALKRVAMMHANLEEAALITGEGDVRGMVDWFTARGVGIICVTCGKDGVYVGTGPNRTHMNDLGLHPNLEVDAFIWRGAFEISPNVVVNASGAGDAFTAGAVAELADSRGSRGVERLADAGLVSALHRIDPSLVKETGASGAVPLDELLAAVYHQERKRLVRSSHILEFTQPTSKKSE